jgi:hypothetical protein
MRSWLAKVAAPGDGRTPVASICRAVAKGDLQPILLLDGMSPPKISDTQENEPQWNKQLNECSCKHENHRRRLWKMKPKCQPVPRPEKRNANRSDGISLSTDMPKHQTRYKHFGDYRCHHCPQCQLNGAHIATM